MNDDLSRPPLEEWYAAIAGDKPLARHQSDRSALLATIRHAARLELRIRSLEDDRASLVDQSLAELAERDRLRDSLRVLTNERDAMLREVHAGAAGAVIAQAREMAAIWETRATAALAGLRTAEKQRDDAREELVYAAAIVHSENCGGPADWRKCEECAEQFSSAIEPEISPGR